jgi:hypothetical protein
MITSPGISLAPAALDALTAVFGRDPHGFGTLANAIRVATDSARVRTDEDRRAVAEGVAGEWAYLETLGAIVHVDDSRMWRLTDRGRTLLTDARARSLEAVAL